MPDDQEAIAEGHPLDFESDPKNPKKRAYKFSYAQAKSCDHPELRIVARGTNLYRCTRCNYGHWIQSAITWPLHWTPIMGMFMLQGFAMEFGAESLRKVLTTPIGTVDQTEHKPPLPSGVSPADAFSILENIEASGRDRAEQWYRFLLADPAEQKRMVTEAHKALAGAGLVGFLLGDGSGEDADERDHGSSDGESSPGHPTAD